MLIAIPTSHHAQYPYRSGYERTHPLLRPVEYYFSASIAGRLRAPVKELGHELLIVDKPRIVSGITSAGYARVHALQIAAVSHADLVVEYHVNRGGAGQHGALCLTTAHPLATSFASSYLRAWLDSTPIMQAGRGIWSGDETRAFGRLSLLHDGPAAACVIELGYASSATDSAYLETSLAVRAAVMSTMYALRALARHATAVL